MCEFLADVICMLHRDPHTHIIINIIYLIIYTPGMYIYNKSLRIGLPYVKDIFFNNSINCMGRFSYPFRPPHISISNALFRCECVIFVPKKTLIYMISISGLGVYTVMLNYMGENRGPGANRTPILDEGSRANHKNHRAPF